MKLFKPQHLPALSRMGRFQFLTVMVILGAGVLVSIVTGWFAEAPDDSKPGRLAGWDEPEIHSRADAVKLLRSVREFRQDFAGTPLPALLGPSEAMLPFEDEPFHALLRPAEATALKTYQAAMFPTAEMTGEQLATIEAAATADPASGLIASMQGDVLWILDRPEEALAAYERGAADAETGTDACRRALLLCVRRQWQDRLETFYARPAWSDAVRGAPFAEHEVRDSILLAAGDWIGLLGAQAGYLRMSLEHPTWLLLSIACGIVWFILLHMASGVRRRFMGVGMAAFALGVASIPLTLFFSSLQHHYTDTLESDVQLTDIIYCISGIGLREELAKLLLFTPLLLVLRGQTTAAHALVAASCTGLGFAITENVNYFAAGDASVGRFLSANFLHLALTGLSGMALWQAVRAPARWLQHFTVVFVGAVCFHGFWDWHPDDPRMAEDIRYLKYAGLAGLAYYYFGELQRILFTEKRSLCPAWVFLAGTALITALTMAALSSIVGFRLGFVYTMKGGLGMYIIAAAMYFQLRRA